MNRRTFATGTAIAALTPLIAAARQEATPQVQPDSQVDVRTRDLTSMLVSVSPATLLEALETAEDSNELLIEENHGTAPTVLPWADYGDTDLYSSLGALASPQAVRI